MGGSVTSGEITSRPEEGNPVRPRLPGVIPLRPLTAGEVLGGAFTTLRRHALHLLAIEAIVLGSALLVGAACYGIAHRTGLLNDLADVDEGVGALVALIGLGAVLAVGLLLATALVSAACAVLLQEGVLGGKLGFSVLWRRTLDRLPAVTCAVLVPGLLTLIPSGLFGVASLVSLLSLLSGDGKVPPAVPLAFLLAFITAAPAIWLAVRFSLAPAVAVFERQGAAMALRRSWRLVRGTWWRTFGLLALALLIATVIGSVLRIGLNVIETIPVGSGSGSDPSFIEMMLVVGVLGQSIHHLLITALLQLVAGVLYVDRRIRTEELAPALAEAAAVHRPSP